MSKLSKKAVLSVLSLVLTFVALGATTFAWFSLGNTATVNPFDVEVRGTEGLEIALVSNTTNQDSPYHRDNARWYSGISSENFYAYVAHLVDLANAEVNDHDGKFVMDAVTSGDGVNFKKFNTINNNTIELEDATANKDYLSFTFLLRTSTNKDINLEALNVTSTRKAPANVWKSDIEESFFLASGKEVDFGEDVDLELADALRISFKEEKDENNDGAVIFEKKAGQNEVSNTEGVMKNPFKVPVTPELDEITNYQYGAFAYFAFKEGYKNSNVITLQPNEDFPEEGYNTETKKFGAELTNNEFVITNSNIGGDLKQYKLTVNVWFEGYDNEAFNALLEQFVTIDMKFALVDEQD